MNYEKIYDSLMLSRKLRGLDKSKLDGYYEMHHIVPTCLGGSDEESNLVLLTAREHFIAHRLLVKLTTGADRHRMLHALASFRCGNGGFKLNARQYEVAKLANAEAIRELVAQGKHNWQTDEAREANSKRMSERMSELAAKGKHSWQALEFREANSKRISERHSGLVAQGKHHWQTNKHSETASQRQKVERICPVCGKAGKGNAMFQHHFANCKSLQLAY